MDEPLSNLDAKIRQKLRIEIMEIQKRLRFTGVYVTHDQEEALSISDNIIVMDQGMVMQTGNPEEVYNNPGSGFVAEFLGNSNIIECEVADGKFCIGDTVVESRDIKNGMVKIIFRASDLILSEKNEDGIEGNIILKGTITEKMFTGGSYRYVIKIGGYEIFADTIEDIDDEEVRLGLPKEKLYIFG